MTKVDVKGLRQSIAAMKGTKAEVSKRWLEAVCEELDELARLREVEEKRKANADIFGSFFDNHGFSRKR